MNVKEYLPKNEYDYQSIIRLSELSDTDFRKIASDVLEYLKDDEHPLFSLTIDLLVLHQDVIISEVKKAFDQDDQNWKRNLLDSLIIRLSKQNKAKLKPLITKSLKVPQLKESATECLEYCFNGRPLIRPAGLFDANKLADVKLQIWLETFKDIYPAEKINNYDHKKYEDYFNRQIDNPEVSLYVVEKDSELCGYMCCGTAEKPYEGISQELSQLNLLKTVQKQHLGKKLFELAARIIEFKGYDEFCFCCNKYNYDAQKFYERMGATVMAEDEDNQDRSLPQIHYHFQIKKKEG